MASACGLYCGLCPRYQSKAAGRCPGCHSGEMRSYCGVWRCCVTKHGYHTCAECKESPCPRLLRALKVEEGLDSFMSHRPALGNLARVREAGLETYLSEQRERRLLVEELLEGYNEGRSMSFYCAACALLPPDEVRRGVDRVRDALSEEATPEEELKAKAKAMRNALQELAEETGVDLRLRRKR